MQYLKCLKFTILTISIEKTPAKLFIILTSSNVIENADTKVIIKKIFGIDNNATYHLKPYRYSFVI